MSSKLNKLFFGIEVELPAYKKGTTKAVALTSIAPHKDKPVKLDTGELVHADCSGAEVATIPSHSVEEVLSSLQRGFDWWNDNYDYLEFKANPVATYDVEQLHPVDDWSIGCSPSVCVWGASPPTPTAYQDTSRCYGLHITFDLPDELYGSIEDIVKSIDYKVALWCNENSFTPDLDKKRRDIGYGRPGEIRIKDFNGKIAIEYRTLPNWAYRYLPFIVNTIESIVFDEAFREEALQAIEEDPDFWKKLVKGEEV